MAALPPGPTRCQAQVLPLTPGRRWGPDRTPTCRRWAHEPEQGVVLCLPHARLVRAGRWVVCEGVAVPPGAEEAER